LKEELKEVMSFIRIQILEVLVNLIEEIKKQEGTKLGKAVQILNQVVGAYAIAVLIKKIQMN
jgi:glucosamine--fructose-6-phosphate aminotransferase (isomerizing)